MAAVPRFLSCSASIILPCAHSKPDNSEITLNDCHIWRYEKPDRQKKLCLYGGLFPRPRRGSEVLEVPTDGGDPTGIPLVGPCWAEGRLGADGQGRQRDATRRKRVRTWGKRRPANRRRNAGPNHRGRCNRNRSADRVSVLRWGRPAQTEQIERCGSGATTNGSAADAAGRRLQPLVMCGRHTRFQLSGSDSLSSLSTDLYSCVARNQTETSNPAFICCKTRLFIRQFVS